MIVHIHRPEPRHDWTWTYFAGEKYLVGEWLSGRGPWHLLANPEPDPKQVGPVVDGAPARADATIVLGAIPELRIGAKVHPRVGGGGPNVELEIVPGVAWLVRPDPASDAPSGPVLRLEPAADGWHDALAKVPWPRIVGLELRLDTKHPAAADRMREIIAFAAPNLRWYRGPLHEGLVAWLPVSLTHLGALDTAEWEVARTDAEMFLRPSARTPLLPGLGCLRVAPRLALGPPVYRSGFAPAVTHLVVSSTRELAGGSFPRLRELVVEHLSGEWPSCRMPALERLVLLRHVQVSEVLRGTSEADAHMGLRQHAVAVETKLRALAPVVELPEPELRLTYHHVLPELVQKLHGVIEDTDGGTGPVVARYVAALVEPGQLADWPKRVSRAALLRWCGFPANEGPIARILAVAFEHSRVIERGESYDRYHFGEVHSALMDLAELLSAGPDGHPDRERQIAMVRRLEAF